MSFLPSARGSLAGAVLALVFLPSAAPALIHLGEAPQGLPPAVPDADLFPRVVAELHHTFTPGHLGTAIGPDAILTAAHLLFAPGEAFLLGGAAHTIVSREDLPDTDLSIARVTPPVGEWVGLYDRGDEERRGVVVFAKGRWKGAEVRVNGVLKGWRQAESGPAGIRWGTNVIAGTVQVTNAAPGEAAGDFLVAEFNAGAGAAEAHFVYGDSGGPVFIRDGSTWKLAGVATAIDGPYLLPDQPGETPFLGAMFDQGGLVVASGDRREPVPELAADQPGRWYAGRVSPVVAELRRAAGLPAAVAAVRHADQFVVVPEGTDAVLWQAATLPGWEVVEVEPQTTAGVPTQWDPVAGRVTIPGATGTPPSSFRVVTRATGGRSGWGEIYLVPPLSGPEVWLGRATNGVPIVAWPAAPGAAPVVEATAALGGSWTDLGPAAAVDGRWFRADPDGRGAGQRFYRWRRTAENAGVTP